MVEAKPNTKTEKRSNKKYEYDKRNLHMWYKPLSMLNSTIFYNP